MFSHDQKIVLVDQNVGLVDQNVLVDAASETEAGGLMTKNNEKHGKKN